MRSTTATSIRDQAPFLAIACGGTGGHLFPGLAVAEVLQQQGCDLALIISPKAVDQQNVKALPGAMIVTLPAAGLLRGQIWKSLWGSWKSYLQMRKLFERRKPLAVLAMGGFISFGPIAAGRRTGARTVLHEANSIPGRANRWLAPFVDEVQVAFPGAAKRIRCDVVKISGMPVRPQFKPLDAEASRMALGLDPKKPVVLVVGGSQGARGLNQLAVQALPIAAASACPEGEGRNDGVLPGGEGKEKDAPFQVLHLTGSEDLQKARKAYEQAGLPGKTIPFLTEMELALGAATIALSRSGASSLAEMAAMEVPSILIPFPAAVDNHQFYNARALVETGAAVLAEERSTTPERLAGLIRQLLKDGGQRAKLQQGLKAWRSPRAAQAVAASLLGEAYDPAREYSEEPMAGGPMPRLFASKQNFHHAIHS